MASAEPRISQPRSALLLPASPGAESPKPAWLLPVLLQAGWASPGCGMSCFLAWLSHKLTIILGTALAEVKLSGT